MKDEIRKSGINIIGDVPWGTHLCQFYQTKEDLLSILVPYFKAGLENNEFCMWVTSKLLTVKEARDALQKAVKDIDQYIKKGQIEILDFSQWYTRTGKFEADKVLQGWVDKEQQARKNGFDGLRLTGNTFWIEKKDWQSFSDYEAVVNSVIHNYKMLAICTYSLDKCRASEVIEVVSNHQFALIRQEGEWRLIESSEHKRLQEKEKEKEEAVSDAAMKETEAGREKLETYMESIIDAVGATDINGNIGMVNRSLEELTGYTRDELLKMNSVQLTAKRDVEKNVNAMKECLEKGFVKDLEINFITKQEKEVPISLNATALKDLEGKPIGTVVVISDITERKKAQEGLLESTLYLDTISDALLVVDADAVFVRMNKAFQNIWGYRQEECIGKNVLGFFAEEEVPKYKREMEMAVQTGQARQFESVALTKDGKRLPVELNGLARKDKDGNLIGFIAIARDITERKQAEKNLQDIIDKNPMSIQIVDKEGFTLSVNPAHTKLFGAVPPSDWSLFNDSQLKQKGLGELLERMKNGEIVHWPDMPYNAHDSVPEVPDVPVWVRAVGFPVNDSKEKPERFVLMHEDITERKRAEEVLRQSETRYKSLVDNLPQKIFMKDRNSVYISINENYARDLNIKPEEISGKTDYDFFHKELAEKYRADDKRIMESGKTEDIEEKYIQNEEERFVHTVKTPVRDEQGNVIGILGIFRDITERKKAEEELRKTQQYSENIVKSMMDALIVFDSNGNIISVNKSAQDLFGYKNEEVIGKPVGIVFEEEEEEEEEEEFRGIGLQKLINKGFIKSVEMTCKTKDGTKIPVLFSGSVMRDEKEKILEVVCVVHDITERKRIEEELKESEQKFKAIFDNAADGMISMDMETTKFHLANRKICKMLNYKIEEILNLGLEELHFPEDIDNIIKQSKKSVIEIKDIPIRKKGKDIIYVDMSVIKMMLAGRIYQICIYKDLIERKRMERELIQAEKLMVLGQLGAGVAHEINNPLGSIIGFTQILMSEIPSSDNKFQDLKRIESAATRCKDMVGGLLKYTSPAKSKFDEVDINKLVEEVLLLFHQEIKLRSDIKIFKYLETSLPQILGNFNQLQQVCMNILINAKNALSKGGEIHVRTKLSRKKKSIDIVFKDNGIGIKRENLPKIFEPFYSLVKSPESLGLGLGISKQIMAIHKGSINVRSKVNKGTTFTIKLPVYHK